MITGDLRKWLSIGAGIGVEVRGADLAVTIARVRPSEVRVLASTTIVRFRERPASEWGTEYNQFLKAAGCGHLAATVLLPRDELIVRQLSFPGVSDRDVEAAVRYRVDSLHPYPEGEASHGWTRLPDSPVVLVGIGRTELIEHYATLFAEAGARTASFTFSAVAIYSAIRTHATPPGQGFLIVEPRDDEFEVYGESPARPVLTATFDQTMDRVVSLSSSELRFEEEIEPTRLRDLLPLPHSNPEQCEE